MLLNEQCCSLLFQQCCSAVMGQQRLLEQEKTILIEQACSLLLSFVAQPCLQVVTVLMVEHNVITTLFFHG